MRQYAIVPMPNGSVGIVATGQSLSNVILTGRCPSDAADGLARSFPDARANPALLPALQRQLSEYFAGKPVQFRVKLDLSALTPFQQEVLEVCRQIKYGETITYGQLARRVGRPKAARAVGRVMASNPVPLVVPCHRVIAGNGKPGGFSAEQGVSLKRWLLKLETAGTSCAGAQSGSDRA